MAIFHRGLIRWGHYYSSKVALKVGEGLLVVDNVDNIKTVQVSRKQ